MTPYIGMKVIVNGGTPRDGHSPTEGFHRGIKILAFVTLVHKDGDVALFIIPPGSRKEFYAPVKVKQGAVDEEGTWHPVPEECQPSEQLDPAGRSGWIDRYDWTPGPPITKQEYMAGVLPPTVDAATQDAGE